nr:unnamed protein product [Callosobruchus chinensis]
MACEPKWICDIFPDLAKH